MALVELRMDKVGFSVKEKKGGFKTILQDVSICMGGGEMLCIQGPSGCGKTSLIHILAQRIRNSDTFNIGGSVLCNGKPMTAAQVRTMSRLVTQESILNSVLSVRETLLYAARLRLPWGTRSERIGEVIRVLGLEKCASTKVGDDSNADMKGISGGEKRRLTIAMEILDPKISLLILDEPTSGLDAAASLNVVQVLRGLADAGITIVTTLHAPRRSIMLNFEQLLVLSEGRRAFYGPITDFESYLVAYLKCELSVHESPYEFLLDAMNRELEGDNFVIGTLGKDTVDISERLSALYASSDLKQRMDRPADEETQKRITAVLQVNTQSRGPGNWLMQFVVVLTRTALIKVRDPMALTSELASAIGMGLLIGAIFWDVYDKPAELAVLDAQMAVTMSIVLVAFAPFDVVLTFTNERRIFSRERKAGWYCSSALFFGRILADVLQHILVAFVQAFIVYFMVGLHMDFGNWLLVNVGAILVGAAMMQLCGAVCRNFDEANVLVIVILVFSMLLSGAFVRVVPSWLSWARNVSIVGLLGDITSYLEFAPSNPAAIALTSRMSENEAAHAVLKLGIILVVFRLQTFLAIKFMHTGQTFQENLWN